MAAAATTGPSTGTSTLRNVNDNQKRWVVFGLALKVLVDNIRSFLAQEIQKEYSKLKTSHHIDTQSASGRLKNWRTVNLKYENINGNGAVPKMKGKHNYSAFDCRVTSHVDFARLYLENHMAKFTAFDEHCDASAVLNLLGKVPVFSVAVQSAAGDVRQARNAWAHCAFSDWNPVKFHQCFVEMERLVKSLGLLPADESSLLTDLKEWESKGTLLCMNITMDPALLQLVQQHVNALRADVDKLVFEVESDGETVKKAMQDVAADLNALEKRVSSVEKENKGVKRSIQSLQDEQSAMKSSNEQKNKGFKCSIQRLQDEQSAMKSDHECLQQRVTQVEVQQNSAIPQISIEIAESEADISFFAERHDADTRQWLFEDFENWFNDPGDSRAYVLLGDAGVGKSVIAGALAQREKNAGHLGAAYFCRHNDGTRNDPRYLLGTVACQLCKCNSLYSNIVGGGNGVRMMLANSKLGVSELFTKLLQEPLGKCTPCKQRKLVIIDALDETEYESREDFLDLLMHRFPRLPKWLLFFITSRPEDTVQFRLKKYNPCIKICAGNGEHLNVYQQHEQDIRRFLEKRVDFPRLPYSVEELVKTCSGLFLYAFYIAKVLNDQGHLGKIDQLSDLFPGNIDNFFQENFQRVFNKVGAELSKKLFGCVIAAPSPLPLSFILFVLKRENSNLDEQEVIDALSQFVVLRTSDETFAFLHNLIPSWLTDRKKAQTFFVDRIEAGEYLRKIIVEFLPAAINDGSKKHPYIENNIFEYVLRVGVRVLCGFDEKDSMNIVYSCFTSYHFIQRRIQNSRIQVYSVIGDFKLSARSQTLGDAEKEILQEICTVLESNIYTLQECPHLLPSCLRSASKNGQLHMAVPDGVSTTWMEWSCFPATHGQRCFSLFPDGKLLAEGKGKYISLFDSCSLSKGFLVLSKLKN